MHYRDLSLPADSLQTAFDFNHAARVIIEQQFAPARSATGMRHIVDFTNLTPEDLKLRREWCRKFAFGGHSIEAINGGGGQKGLRFKFSVGPVATLFGLLHTAWGTRSSKGRV